MKVKIEEKSFFEMNPLERLRYSGMIEMEPYKWATFTTTKIKTNMADRNRRAIPAPPPKTETEETYIDEIIRQNNLLTERLQNAKDKLLNLHERLISEPFALNEEKGSPIAPSARLDVLHRRADDNNELASSINDLLNHLVKFL